MHEDLKKLNEKGQEAMDGSPATMRDAAGFINIKFQCGPVGEVGVNGTSIENVLALVTKRLKGFQRGPFACQENEAAIVHLKCAMKVLDARTKARVAQGVEGKNEAHHA